MREFRHTLLGGFTVAAAAAAWSLIAVECLAAWQSWRRRDLDRHEGRVEEYDQHIAKEELDAQA